MRIKHGEEVYEILSAVNKELNRSYYAIVGCEIIWLVNFRIEGMRDFKKP